MNLAIVTNSEVTIESREVADMVEKNHKELLRDIRTMIGYLGESKIAPSDFFIKSTYRSEQGKELPCYLITKQGCEMVANKLTGKKGILFTAQYVKKFNEMEQENIDSYMITDPIQRAEKWIKEQREKALLLEQNQIKDQLIAEYEPKISYLDKILESKGVLATSQIAADYGMTPQKLNKILFEEGVQHKVGGQWILYSKHMNKGYTKSQTINIVRSDGSPDTKMNTKWTQKGRLFIHELLERKGVSALMDKEEDK